MKRRFEILQKRAIPFEPLGTATGEALDVIAKHFNLVRHVWMPGRESDENLRIRCRHALEVSVGLYPGAFTDP